MRKTDRRAANHQLSQLSADGSPSLLLALSFPLAPQTRESAQNPAERFRLLMRGALRALVALSAISAIAADQLTTSEFSVFDELNSPSIIDAQATHRRLQLTAKQTADVLCSASMYAEESCNKARSAAERMSPPPQPPGMPGATSPSPPPPPFGPRTESPSPPPAVAVFNPPPPPPASAVTLLMAVSGVNSDYPISQLIALRNIIVDKAGVSTPAVTISSSAGLGGDPSGRRLAEKIGAVTSTAVVLTMTIQPSPENVGQSGTEIIEKLTRSRLDGGLGQTVAEATEIFKDLKLTSRIGMTPDGIQVLFISLAGEEDCLFKEDGVCDDGGPDPKTGGTTSGLCPFGSDQMDCGTRNAPNGAAFLKAQKDLEEEEAALNSDEPAATGQPYIPSYPGEPCFQQRSIHVSGRSPTTDLVAFSPKEWNPNPSPGPSPSPSPSPNQVAFSPKEWPVENHPVTKEARKSLQILQIGCDLSQDDRVSCYSDENAFDSTSAMSNTKRYPKPKPKPEPKPEPKPKPKPKPKPSPNPMQV